jgi:hypothetical protein
VYSVRQRQILPELIAVYWSVVQRKLRKMCVSYSKGALVRIISIQIMSTIQCPCITGLKVSSFLDQTACKRRGCGWVNENPLSSCQVVPCIQMDGMIVIGTLQGCEHA